VIGMRARLQAGGAQGAERAKAHGRSEAQASWQEGGEVRPWDPNDAESMAYHANDRDIWRNLRDTFPHPYGIDDARRFIASAPPTFLCIAWAGAAVGGIGLSVRTDVERFSAELGYWIGRPYWGRGIATEAVRAVVAWGFGELGLRRIYALPYAHNGASCRVLEKCGFTLEGRLAASSFKEGRFVDQHMYARVAGDHARPTHALTILAVPDLARAVAFYRAALDWPVIVETPVYVELAHAGRRLGVYRRDGFAQNTGRPPAAVADHETASAELYFYCDLDVAIEAMERAGAECLSPRAARSWGDEAAYYRDPFGHVIVLARAGKPSPRDGTAG
jgi:RimJ/RimL family protein N-acetyltransferase/catechol 2,3-dioxygenase-like lactoylglutathione lyase family enzyme